MSSRRCFVALFLVSVLYSFLGLTFSFGQVTPPEQFLGFKPGADFKLATYEQALGYLELLANQTKRVKIFDMGPTTYGRRMKYAVISSDENIAKLETYKEINRKLSLARGLAKAEAEKLAEEGKAIVWIDGGLHEGEVSGAQQLPQLAYDLVTGNDRQSLLIRENTILVLVLANPDGMTIVSDWYSKNVGTEFEISPLPSINTKLRGTNRDSFISNLLETRNLNRATSKEWYPEILYNQHQTAPFPARIYVPPESEKTNPNVHPILIREKNFIGTAMARALEEEDKTGAISRISFDSYWTGYHLQYNDGHNTPSILTETAMYPYATPHHYGLSDFPEEYRNLTVGVFYPSPWKGGWWRLADAVAYNITVSKGILELAAHYRHEFLYNKWKMANDIIERFKKEAPYGWIISADQRDPNTSAMLLNKFILYGIEVYKAANSFVHEGVSYPKGSYVIPTSQPFGLYAKNLLEIQPPLDIRKYPHLWHGLVDLVKYEGPPVREYDGSGWTLPYQMGIDSRIMSKPLDPSVSLILSDEVALPAGMLTGSGSQVILSSMDNSSFLAVNRILKSGGKVSWALKDFSFGGANQLKGTFIVDSGSIGAGALKEIASKSHIAMKAGSAQVESKPLNRSRVGIYNSWVQTEDASWSNWVFDEYGFPYQILRDGEVKVGNLGDSLDVIILPDQGPDSILNGYRKGTIPADYAGGVTPEGRENLKKFVEEGGTLVCNQGSTGFAIDAFQLPLKNVLSGIKTEDFFCPGTILKMDYDTSHPLAFGMEGRGIAFLKGSPYAYEILTDPKDNPRKLAPKVVARFPNEQLLISGFFLGDDKVKGMASVLDIPVGKGRIILFGFNVLNRAQTHSTFKLLFNSVYYK